MSALTEYTLHLADNALILAQRNAEWCGHGPVLEQDIAITNITLDLVGQARSFYQYAAQIINESPEASPLRGSQSKSREGTQFVEGASEDSLAYTRTEREFRNCLLLELPKGDWAQTVLRQFFFSAYQYYLYRQLLTHTDGTLAAIAEKSLKEVSYHLRWSGEWVIRLGDGTGESHQRLLQALDELWRYTGELFLPASYERESGIDLRPVQKAWTEKVNAVFEEATLQVPSGIYMQQGGKTGSHTEQLGYILTDLQYLQRVYPGAEW